MAAEFTFWYTPTGLTTLYAIAESGANIVKASDGSLIAATTANFPQGKIALSDAACTGRYVAAMPAGVVAGEYVYNVYQQAGGAPVDGDAIVGQGGVVDWNGTAAMSVAALPTAAQVDTQLTGTHGAGAWGGGGGGTGSGAWPVTIKVTSDGTTPISNANVRIAGVGVTNTNGSGIASFSLDSATYTVSITYGGYTFAPTAYVLNSVGHWVVGGATQLVVTMTENVVPTPTDPSKTVAQIVTRDQSGTAVVGKVTFKLVSVPVGASGSELIGDPVAYTSDGTGVLNVQLLRNGYTYHYWGGASGKVREVVTPDLANFTLADVIGVG